MANITINDAELRELVRKHAQRAAAEYLANRTIPKYPAYFFESNWLVTYDHLQQEILARQDLQRRVMLLERPWFKRWFKR